MPARPNSTGQKHDKEPPLARWDIFAARSKAKLLGTVAATDADAAIEVAAKEFEGVDPKRLIAVRR